MNVKLIYPPFWNCNSPYLSIPSLVAYLHKHGIQVEQMDLNLEVYDMLLSESFMNQCIMRLSLDTKKIKESPFLLDVARFFANGVEHHKRLLKSKEALGVDVYEKCSKFLGACLAVVNAAYETEHEKSQKVGFTKYDFGEYDAESFYSILKSAKNAQEGNDTNLINTLLLPFVEHIVQNADLIGISLTGLNQIIPTFSLLGHIKRESPSTKIVLGGSIVTRWFADDNNLPDIFDYTDYVVINEGEVPLVSLINSLKGCVPIEDVPQLIYRDESGKINKNLVKKKLVNTSDLPTPMFNKVDVPRYFSPEPVLPLLSSRGCYWGKCAFCDHFFVYGKSFRQSKVDKIISDISSYIST